MSANRRKGRPSVYDNAEEMKKRIEDYFNNVCADEIIKDEQGRIAVDTKGRPVIKFNPPTISGLARYLGFKSRSSFYEYGEKGDFADIIKDAILRTAEYAEKQLTIGNPTGAIFWLKNHGWKDKTEVDNKLQADDSFREFVESITSRK